MKEFFKERCAEVTHLGSPAPLALCGVPLSGSRGLERFETLFTMTPAN